MDSEEGRTRTRFISVKQSMCDGFDMSSSYLEENGIVRSRLDFECKVSGHVDQGWFVEKTYCHGTALIIGGRCAY